LTLLRKFILIGLFSATAATAANLTLEDYWQLTKLRLELAAVEWQERITVAEQAKGDRKVFMARSEAITKQYAGHQRSLHLKFGATPLEYLHFETDHAREIDSYLQSEEGAGVKREIERLRGKIQGLMQRFDGLNADLMREDK